MRKYVPWLIGAVVVLAGGALYASRYQGSERAVPAETTDFNGVMAQMHEAYTQDALELFPEFKVPEKTESTFAFHGDLNTDEAVAQKITFDMNATGKSDYSNSEDPVAESNVKISGEMKNPDPSNPGTDLSVGKGALELGFKIVNQKLMLALLKAEASQNGQEFPVALIVGPYLGKWYGGTFDEVNALIAQYAGTDSGIRLENSFESPNKALENLKTRLKIALGKVHFWKLEEALPEENEMLRYQVSLDQEALKQSLFALAELGMTNPDGTVRTTQLEETKAEIERTLAEENITLEGILSVKKSDVQQFTFDGTLTDQGEASAVKVARLEDELSISVQDGTDSGTFELKDKNFKATMNDKTVLEGTIDDNELSGKAMDESGVEVANFRFEKGLSKEISGQVVLPQENMSVNVQKLEYSDESFTLELNIVQGGNTIFQGNMTYEISETGSVTVEEPASLEPLQNLIGGFMGTLGAPAEVPSGTMAP